MLDEDWAQVPALPPNCWVTLDCPFSGPKFPHLSVKLVIKWLNTYVRLLVTQLVTWEAQGPDREDIRGSRTQTRSSLWEPPEIMVFPLGIPPEG